VSLKQGESAVELDVNMETAIENAKFRSGKDSAAPVVTDIFWPRPELYQEPPGEESAAKDDQEDGEGEEETEGE
jgi:hypothetical protein